MNKIKTEIITPHGKYLEGEYEMVLLPSFEGEVGIKKGHTPFIFLIKEGAISIFEDEKEISRKIKINSGFAEVNNNKLLILSDGDVEDLKLEEKFW